MKHQEHLYFRDLIITFFACALVFWWTQFHWIYIIGGIWVIAGMIFRQIRVLNHKFWSKLTQMIQWITQPIIGTIIFVFVLTPIGLLSQLFQKKERISNSTFKNVETKINDDYFRKQW